MKNPISAYWKLRKVVVKSGDLLALAVLGILPQQYLCTINNPRGVVVGSKEIFPKDKKGHIINIKSAIILVYCRLYIIFATQ